MLFNDLRPEANSSIIGAKPLTIIWWRTVVKSEKLQNQKPVQRGPPNSDTSTARYTLRLPQPIEPIVHIDTNTEANIEEGNSFPPPVNPQQDTEEDDFLNETVEDPAPVQANFQFKMNIQINSDSFKGQGEDPNKWFTYFEKWAAFMNMNGDRAAMALPFYLRSIAKTWFDSLSEATQVN